VVYYVSITVEVKMKRLNQAKIAKELSISKSYLSMILSGQRKCPPELTEKLQSVPGIHKVVNNQLWLRTGSQKVVGSNPISSTNTKASIFIYFY
jgi:transcriptional regulator with XRE-family HTH domain